MDDLENILDELKEKLDCRYENTSLDVLDDRIFVSFNDTYNNALAIYSDRDRFCVTNFKNWDNGEFNVVIEWTQVSDYDCLNDLVDFFDDSYLKMVEENEEYTDNLRKGLSDRTFKIIFGDYVPIGKKISD